MIKVAIITISDSRNKKRDLSGRVISGMLNKDIFTVVSYEVVPDELERIKNEIVRCCDKVEVDLLLTTGGTGVGPRDVTPEATNEVIDKKIPGIPELIRIQGAKETERAFLSRAVSGIRKNTLIINLPGSPKGVKESLGAVVNIIIHAIDMIRSKSHQ